MSLSTENFDLLREILRRETGMLLGAEKCYLAESRLAPLARRYADNDLNALIERVRYSREGDLRRELVEAMAIHETFFFRDPGMLECLRTVVLPDLIERRRPDKRLNIWSAACSSGQEPYTVCIMLREYFPELEDWDIHVLASDFSRPVLERARQGRYSITDINRGMPAKMLVSHFRQHGLEWEVGPSLRRMVDFREINLIGQWPSLPSFDLILLRNVLIYFDDDSRAAVIQRMRRQLDTDGYLMLGGTELSQPMQGFEQGIKGLSVPCYQPALQG